MTSPVDVSQMFINTTASSKSILTFIPILAFVTGVIISGFGFWKISKMGQNKEPSDFKQILWIEIVGVLLVNYAWTVGMFSNTLSVGGEVNFLSSAPAGGASSPSGLMSALMISIFLIIQVIGNITFFRGVWMMKKWGEGGKSLEIWQPMLLIVLGSLAINIQATIKIFAETTGLNLSAILGG